MIKLMIMKKLINKYTIILILAGFGLSSCYKKFDQASYAPPLNVNGSTNANQIGKANLVAYWNFNNNLIDSVSKTAGTATNTSFSTGLKNYGTGLFGGNNAYVVSAVPANIQNLHSFTVSTWVNMPVSDSSAVYDLVGIANAQNFWSNLDIFFDGGGTSTNDRLKIHVWNNGTSVTGVDAWLGDYTVNAPYGGWVNITLTYDDSSSTFVVYYNGSSIGTSTFAGFAPLNWTGVQKMVFGTFPFMTNPSLTTGATAQDWATYLPGTMDEVRVYNRVLTNVEVGSLVALQRRGK